MSAFFLLLALGGAAGLAHSLKPVTAAVKKPEDAANAAETGYEAELALAIEKTGVTRPLPEAQPVYAAQPLPAAQPALPAVSRPAAVRAAPKPAGFINQLRDAESQTGEIARRLERLEMNMARIEAAKALESLPAPKPVPAGPVVKPDEGSGQKASQAALTLCAAAEKKVAARRKPAVRRARGKASAAAGPVPMAVNSMPALSGRMAAVLASYGRNGDMVETARELRMGLAEVEFALKVNNMVPARC